MRAILFVVVLGFLAAACSKDPAETAPEATPPLATDEQQPAPAAVDLAAAAAQDAAKLAEYIDPRPECGQFKDRLMAIAQAAQSHDTMAKDFTTVMSDATAAGCTVRN